MADFESVLTQFSSIERCIPSSLAYRFISNRKIYIFQMRFVELL